MGGGAALALIVLLSACAPTVTDGRTIIPPRGEHPVIYAPPPFAP